MEWKAWQIILMAVFGTVWIVFFILDTKRKIALQKRRKAQEQELKAQGYSDKEIKEIMKQRNHPANKTYVFSKEQGTGKEVKGGEK